MVDRIKVNMNALEGMIYFWQSCTEKEKVSEQFLNDLSIMPELTCFYDEEFDGESVRRTLSAITNREPFKANSKKESRFWNYNMWVMEDMEYTKAMIDPLKKLNLSSIIEEINSKKDCPFEEIEVIFTPMHFDDFIVSKNKLIINFFKVKPGDFDDNTYIGDIEIKEYILDKIINNVLK